MKTTRYSNFLSAARYDVLKNILRKHAAECHSAKMEMLAAQGEEKKKWVLFSENNTPENKKIYKAALDYKFWKELKCAAHETWIKHAKRKLREIHKKTFRKLPNQTKQQ
jgi:hypothetical protein